jgi:lathosterol oxidase
VEREPGGREFRFGEGKISGVASASLGGIGFAAVLCLHYPNLLTTPDLRALYPLPLVRGLIQAVLLLAFVLGVLNVLLGWRRATGLCGIALSVIAALMGGSKVVIEESVDSTRALGLDWFILNLFFLALLFIPLERVFRRLDQKIFRPGWTTDLSHFMVSHIAVQVTVLLTMVPAVLLFRWAGSEGIQAAVASQPIALQFIEALVLADLFAYAIHRLFHAVPLLWRFHAIHHSSEALDWLAGSRLHIVDILVTRAVAFLPLYLVGFSTEALYPYLVFASMQAILIHSNLRFTFGPLRHLLVTPQFHHWHHTAEAHAVDKNFAIHLPWIDRIFGTHYLPGDRWPERYGVDGLEIAPGYLNHLIYPLRSRGGRSNPMR